MAGAAGEHRCRAAADLHGQFTGQVCTGHAAHTVGSKILTHKKYLTFDKSNPFQAVPLSIACPSGELITARCPEPGTCVWLDQNRLCWPLSSGAPDSGAFMPRCS